MLQLQGQGNGAVALKNETGRSGDKQAPTKISVLPTNPASRPALGPARPSVASHCRTGTDRRSSRRAERPQGTYPAQRLKSGDDPGQRPIQNGFLKNLLQPRTTLGKSFHATKVPMENQLSFPRIRCQATLRFSLKAMSPTTRTRTRLASPGR